MNRHHRFWLLTALRWLPTGFIIPVVALLPLDRGLTIVEYGSVVAVQGVVVLLLELPTGALADALGRKPLLVAAGVFGLGSYVVYALAQSTLAFAASSALAGVFRALDSGPLNAWFVDSVHDDPDVVDRADTVARGLSGAAVTIGLAIAGGAVLAGVLVVWEPVGRIDALALPYWIAAVLALVQIAVTVAVMDEDRSARAGGVLTSVRATPAAVLTGLRLMTSSRVLLALVAVELFWGFGIVAFEIFTPVRLAELLDDREGAAALMGPVVAVGWAISALGAAAVPLLIRRWSMVAVSVVLRIVQGATVIGMGLALGPVGLVAGYLATYAVHVASGVVYETLLHEQVGNENRATVLSLSSMAMHPAGSLGSVVLGLVATGASTGTALVVGGVVLMLAAPLFLVRGDGPRGRRGARRERRPMLDRDGGHLVADDTAGGHDG